MKNILSTSQVIDTLLDHEVLGQRTDACIIEATEALVNWLEDLEDATGEEMELDPVGLRCAFTLYTLEECAEVWDIADLALQARDRSEFILDYLQCRTTVIEVDADTYIVQEF